MFGIGSLISGITGLFGSNLVGKIFGNREARDQAVHDEQTDVLQEFAAENVERDDRTWWDSLIDGLNRLPRPLGFFLTLAVLIWPIVNPLAFASAVTSWSIVPAWMVQLIMGVWALYFGGRIISQDIKFSGPTSSDVKDMLAHQQEIKSMIASGTPSPVNSSPAKSQMLADQAAQEKQDEAAAQKKSAEIASAKISSREYDKEMTSSKPLSLPALVAWNEKNNPNFHR